MTIASARPQTSLPFLASIAIIAASFALAVPHPASATPAQDAARNATCSDGNGKCRMACDEGAHEIENDHDASCPTVGEVGGHGDLNARLKCCLLPASTRTAEAEAEPEGEAIQAIEPVLSIPIPNLSFSETRFIDEAGEVSKLDLPFIADYIQAIYDYAIGIAAVLAATMMMVGGFQYLMAGGDNGKVTAGKKRISDALVGLILALGAYTVLTTVSESLVSIGSIRVETIKREILQEVEVADSGDADGGGATPSSGDAICQDAETCKPYCDAGAKSYPKSGGVTIDPSGTAPIQESPGLRNPGIKDPGRGYATPAMTTALQKAGQIALREGYELRVVSAYRPVTRQFQIACSVIAEGNAEKIGGIVSRPGASNHGTGKAADIALLKNGRQISATSADVQGQEKYRESSIILANIMAEAGFKRYSKEVWHFEIDSDRPCRCTGSACPFPPKC